jgi:serine/threonine protein kinase
MQPEHEVEKPTAFTDQSGLEVFDRNFEIFERLGAGGFSIVYRAKQHEPERVVALKVLHAHLLKEEMSKKRFQREMKLVSGLSHPNVAEIYEGGFLESGQPYMAMEVVKGRSLGHMVVERGSLWAEDAIPIFVQVCDGLAAAHAREVLHRDLKPSNLLIAENEPGSSTKYAVKVLDFGLARPMGRLAFDTGELTVAGETVGTPPYMSPEQCTGKDLDGRSDVYALGCVMYEALSGYLPFNGAVIECMKKQVCDAPTPFTARGKNPEIAEALTKIIFKALEKKPSHRYQSMRHMRQDLQSCLQSEGVRAPLANMPLPIGRPSEDSQETTAPQSAGSSPSARRTKEALNVRVLLLIVALFLLLATLAITSFPKP